MAQAQYDRLADDAPLNGGLGADAPFSDSPVSTYPPPPAYRQSLDSDGSGSDLVYRDIAEEDPFDTEKGHNRSSSYQEDGEDQGYAMEPRRVSLLFVCTTDNSCGHARSRARSSRP